jgi:hypothetical protein
VHTLASALLVHGQHSTPVCEAANGPKGVNEHATIFGGELVRINRLIQASIVISILYAVLGLILQSFSVAREILYTRICDLNFVTVSG